MKLPFSLLSVLLLLPFLSFAQTPTQDTTLANQYYQQATELLNDNNLEEAIQALEKADAIYKIHPASEQLVRTKSFLSHCYLKQKNFKQAETLANEALEIGVKHFGEESYSLSYAYHTLTLIEAARDYNKALDIAYKGLAASDKNSSIYFDHAYNIINLFDEQGNEKGLISIGMALDKTLSEHDRQQYKLLVYHAKAVFNDLTFNFEKSILLFNQILNSGDVEQVYDEVGIISIYNALAFIHAKIDQFDNALAIMDKVQEIATFPKNSPDYASIYETIGHIYSFQKKHQTAVEYLQQAADCFMVDSVHYKEMLCTEFGNIASEYYDLEEYDKAIRYVERSRQFGTQDFHDFLLGKIYFKKKDYQESAKAYHRSLLQFCTQFNSPNFMDNPPPFEEYTIEQYASFVLKRKGEAFIKWGEAEKDTALLRKGIYLFEQVTAKIEDNWSRSKGYDISQYQNSSFLVKALVSQTFACKAFYRLQPTDEMFNKIFLISEKRKALQLIETLTPKLLPKETVQKEYQLLEQVKTVQQRLYLAQTRNEVDSLKYLKALQFEAYQAMEKHLDEVKENYPKASNHFYNTAYANYQDIQQSLSPNTLMISYNVEKGFGEVFTISATTKTNKTIFFKDLEKNIQTLNKLIQNRFDFQTTIRNKFIDVSHELYKALIEPIEKELEGKTRLMIVVEGQLFHLPFELLLASKEKKPYHELDFLIKKYEINYNYSATAFLHLQEKQTPQDNSLLAFAPVFKKGEELNETTRSLNFMIDSLYNGFDKGEFAALPSTKKEATNIAKLVKTNGGSANLLLQKDATKNRLSQQLEQQPYQFIHIATHSFVNFKNPKLSAFACFAADEQMDNLMYANEIQFKNINADLVVLSSCESGIGQLVAGEGLIALNRSFIYSGAKNVLFSLWKVSDQYSSELMIDFYKFYFENPSYTSALRQAKLKMLKNPESAKPKYWSAFVLMGQ